MVIGDRISLLGGLEGVVIAVEADDSFKVRVNDPDATEFVTGRPCDEGGRLHDCLDAIVADYVYAAMPAGASRFRSGVDAYNRPID